MPSYDIRLLNTGNGLASIFQAVELNDLAAIGTGQRLAKQGHSVEVWRGMNCIYATQEYGGFLFPWQRNGSPTTARVNA